MKPIVSLWQLKTIMHETINQFCVKLAANEVSKTGIMWASWGIYSTSNVTSITEVRRLSTSACLPVHGTPCWVNTLLCCDYFSSSSVISLTFSALCVYSKFGHHPHPRGYLCAKFCFFHGLHCWASPWRKIATNYSPSLFDAPRTEAPVLQNMCY